MLTPQPYQALRATPAHGLETYPRIKELGSQTTHVCDPEG